MISVTSLLNAVIPQRMEDREPNVWVRQVFKPLTKRSNDGKLEIRARKCRTLQFSDTVSVYEPAEDPISKIDKKVAWYSPEDLSQFSKNDKLLAKYLRGVSRCGGDPDFLGADICLRGMENTLTTRAKITARSRRVGVAQSVIDEQIRQQNIGIFRPSTT
jgi:hypothetical protein